MSYENAPATKMLATHCAVCRRPLVDAVSVETGMGPDCREKHGFNVEADPDAREAANKLVHEVALVVDGARLKLIVLSLKVYGFSRLADVLIDRNARIKISVAGAQGGSEFLAVTTPYDPDFVAAFKRALPWKRWDHANKVWLVPAGSRDALHAVLKRFFGGALGIGPKGLFVLAEG